VASHLTEIQRDIIAHRHVTGTTIAVLAAEYDRTEASMRQMLKSPGMQQRMLHWQRELQGQSERARAFMQDNALKLAKQLLEDATHEQAKVRAWALPLALRAAGVAVEKVTTTRYEGIGTVKHEHEHHVEGEVEVTHTPKGAAVVSALREMLGLMRERYAVDVTASPHVLEGEAARPRPEGYESMKALTARTTAPAEFKPPPRPNYAVNPDADTRQSY
jgi:hypothetical protein